MKHKFSILYLGFAFVLLGCASTHRPMPTKLDYRISFSTEMALGDFFTFYVNAEKEDQDCVWLDRNNNGVQDADEKITSFGYGKKHELTFPLESQQMTLYGKVTAFGCSTNKITSLEVHNNPVLEYLVCSQNNIQSLNLHSNTRLKILQCFRNKLRFLDVGNNMKLEELWCSSNRIITLNVSKNTELTQLWCDRNRLTTLDVSLNTELEDIACGGNPLTSLDIRTNTQLQSIECMGCDLRSLDVSYNTQLKELMCSFNRLTKLDLHNNPKLEKLWFAGNRFTTLDVSANTDLYDIDCSDNKLTGEGMEAFIQSIPPCSSGEEGKLVVVNTEANIKDKNICTAVQVSAMKAKNWMVYSYGGYFKGENIYTGADAEPTETRNIIQAN